MLPTKDEHYAQGGLGQAASGAQLFGVQARATNFEGQPSAFRDPGPLTRQGTRLSHPAFRGVKVCCAMERKRKIEIDLQAD